MEKTNKNHSEAEGQNDGEYALLEGPGERGRKPRRDWHAKSTGVYPRYLYRSLIQAISN